MPILPAKRRRVVAILEVMWDWRAKTSSAGYAERAPEYYRINPENLTGSRLYAWLGKQGEYFDELLVTNACPELVTSAKGRGTPDPNWLAANMRALEPYDLLLVCGRVAQETYRIPNRASGARIIELPHPAARMWSRKSLATAGEYIRSESKVDLELFFRNGRLTARNLIPF